MAEHRPVFSEAAVLSALAHPVRLDVLNYLMSAGPATASVCARAVGDSPSNCSYHLRVLARYGLVESDLSGDGRERPWRTKLTGFSIADGDEAQAPSESPGAALLAASVQLDQRLARDYLAGRQDVPREWRVADVYAQYTLRATPQELISLAAQLDALLRPLIAATRAGAPAGAELVHVGVQAFPRLGTS